MANAARIGIRMSMSFETTSDGAKEMWEKDRNAMKKFYSRVRTSRQENPTVEMREIMTDECNSEKNLFE